MAGAVTTLVSNGFTFDPTPPTSGYVVDGLDVKLEANILFGNESIGFSWAGPWNETEYGEHSLTYSNASTHLHF